MKRFILTLILASFAIGATGNAFAVKFPECPDTPWWCDYCHCE